MKDPGKFDEDGMDQFYLCENYLKRYSIKFMESPYQLPYKNIIDIKNICKC